MGDHYHFVGVGGIGMSALAEWLASEGHSVSGSDQAASAITKRLENLGVKVSYQHDAENISPHSTVIYSSGIPKGNVEMASAQNKGCVLLHRSDLICHLVRHSPLLVVTGAHGKTYNDCHAG